MRLLRQLFSMGMPPVVAVLFSIVICAVLGVLVEFLAYRRAFTSGPTPHRTYNCNRCLAYFLQSVALLIFGSEQKAFPAIISLPTITIGAVQIDGITLATLVITAIIMIALTLFINRTRLGKAMRAVSEDKGAAELMGI